MIRLTLPSGDIWPDMIQGSEQWLAARKGRATASQFKKLLTPTGKLSAQADAYARKLARECKLPDPLEFSGNKATEWGTEREPEARAAFIELEGVEVIEVGFVTHKIHSCVGCSPDGLIIGDNDQPVAGLEIKAPQIDNLVDWMMDGVLPAEHMAQVHGSMIVTGLKRWEFVGYFPGAPLFRQTVLWSDYTDKLAAVIEQFVARYTGEDGIRAKVLAALTMKEAA